MRNTFLPSLRRMYAGYFAFFVFWAGWFVALVVGLRGSAAAVAAAVVSAIADRLIYNRIGKSEQPGSRTKPVDAPVSGTEAAIGNSRRQPH